MRHGFRNNVIMGGNPFATGAAVIDPDIMADQVVDHFGLDFQIAPALIGSEPPLPFGPAPLA